MKTALYVNESKKNSNLIQDRILVALEDNFIEYYFAKRDFTSDTDFVIVIGGDGTILSIGEECAKKNIPIIGINSGKVGFLTVGDDNTRFDLLFKRITCGEYFLEKRNLLRIRYGEQEYLALNEVTVDRGDRQSILSLSVSCNGESVFSFFGDGICVATPTGSTAYNLSAGGPIVKSDLEVFVLTPICPHTLTAKPIVVGGKDLVQIICNSEEKAILSVDGQRKDIVDAKGVIKVTTAEEKLSFICLTEQEFFSKIRVKLFS